MLHPEASPFQAEVVDTFLGAYADRGAVLAIIQTGSSVEQPVDQCLDIDLVVIVADASMEGDLLVNVGDNHIDALVTTMSNAKATMGTQLRTNSVAMATMLRDGLPLFGSHQLFAELRAAAIELLAQAQPMVSRMHVGYMAHTLLSSLRRANAPADVLAATISVISFLAKSSGPLEGGWKGNEKRLLRGAFASHGSDGRLRLALASSLQGDAELLVQYLEAWIARYELPRVHSIDTLRRPMSARTAPQSQVLST